MDAVPSPQAEFVPTTATTIDEVVRAAYFVAASIDAPVVEVVNPHVINLHYPADGSLATVKVEARSGAWGGLGIKGTLEEDAARNARYDELLAASQAPPPDIPLAREGVQGADWPVGTQDYNPNPVYEVQRQ